MGAAHAVLQSSLGVESELRRVLKEPSKSHERTKRDQLKVEQARFGHRECGDEPLGFRHVITLHDQHGPRLVVRTQIELTHLVDLVALPHAAGLFAYVRIDMFPPDPASRMPNGQYLHALCSVLCSDALNLVDRSATRWFRCP